MNVILLGFKASGKSTLGRALALELRREFLDIDNLAEELYAARHTGRPGPPLDCRGILLAHGAETLRDLEAEAIEMLRSRAAEDACVIAAGGGIILRERNMEALRRLGLRVFLDAPLPLLEERLRGVDSPLFAQKSVAELYRERLPLYERFADLRFPVTENLPPTVLASGLAARLREML